MSGFNCVSCLPSLQTDTSNSLRSGFSGESTGGQLQGANQQAAGGGAAAEESQADGEIASPIYQEWLSRSGAAAGGSTGGAAHRAPAEDALQVGDSAYAQLVGGESLGGGARRRGHRAPAQVGQVRRPASLIPQCPALPCSATG